MSWPEPALTLVGSNSVLSAGVTLTFTAQEPGRVLLAFPNNIEGPYLNDPPLEGGWSKIASSDGNNALWTRTADGTETTITFSPAAGSPRQMSISMLSMAGTEAGTLSDGAGATTATVTSTGPANTRIDMVNSGFGASPAPAPTDPDVVTLWAQNGQAFERGHTLAAYQIGPVGGGASVAGTTYTSGLSYYSLLVDLEPARRWWLGVAGWT